MIIVRLLAVSALFATAAAPTQPKPLRGVPLRSPTHLRLLVASDPPFVFDVDTGHITQVAGLDVRGNPVLSVLGVGEDAVVWLDRRESANAIPAAEIYVIRHGTVRATRIATGWEVAPAADGQAIWLLSYADPQSCALSEVGLDGRVVRPPSAIPCSSQLIGTGSGAALVQGGATIDPATGRTLLRSARVWAIAGRYALAGTGSHAPLTLSDLAGGVSRRLRWPSPIQGTDQAVVHPGGRLIALDFADPAYGGGGTQVMDVWLLDPATRQFQHLPDMPAAVHLKFTSMTWSPDGRLVLLAGPGGGAGGRNLVAVWRPGQRHFAVRPVRLPARGSGSDAFVIWPAAR